MTYSEAQKNLTTAIRRCVDDCKRNAVMQSYEVAEIETRHQKDTPANVAHLKQSMEEIEKGEVISVNIDGLKARLKATPHAF